MKIVLDIRESGLIDACKSMCHNYSNVCIETAQLPLGDIIFKTEEEKEFSQELLILFDLFRKAKAKELYPPDHPLYFQRSNEKSQINKKLF